GVFENINTDYVRPLLVGGGGPAGGAGGAAGAPAGVPTGGLPSGDGGMGGMAAADPRAVWMPLAGAAQMASAGGMGGGYGGDLPGGRMPGGPPGGVFPGGSKLASGRFRGARP